MPTLKVLAWPFVWYAMPFAPFMWLILCLWQFPLAPFSCSRQDVFFRITGPRPAETFEQVNSVGIEHLHTLL